MDDIREDSQTNVGMWKEKKTVKLEKHEPETCPMIVMKSQPRMRDVKSKEKIKVTTTNSKRLTTTCETSGNIMRLRVNLMPVLAATKEPVEEEEWKEVENIWTSKKKPETRLKNEPTDCKSMEQTFDSFKGLNLDTKQALNPQPVLPSITQPKPAAECQVTKRCHTPLPPISLSEQNVSISSDFTIKDCSSDVLDTRQGADSRPWIDNPLFSKSVSKILRWDKSAVIWFFFLSFFYS